jgi:lysophospholipase L1-like esterase
MRPYGVKNRILIGIILFASMGTDMDHAAGQQFSHPYRILALGDSYTAGEGAPKGESFIQQANRYLQKEGIPTKLQVIAVTGWTTEDLGDAIDLTKPATNFDAVTLLIGVNDQFRGYSLKQYQVNFEALLEKAIFFAQGSPGRVVVLSIPDWGVTPYARKYSRETPQQISASIDSFNAVNRAISARFGTQYLDVTGDSRMMKTDASLLAGDELHPSAKEYGVWSRGLIPLLLSIHSDRSGSF